MFGLIAKAKNKKLKIDKNEIEDAFWISKQELKQVLNGRNNNIIAAREGTIARFLLEKWVKNEIYLSRIKFNKFVPLIDT